MDSKVMTEQVLEKIIFAGENERLLETPLESYFELIESEINFQNTASNCWRGYVGQWEIIDDRVYLVGFSAQIRISGNQIHLEDLFPGFSDRVFAHWITGELKIPKGKWVNYRYERIINLHVRAGVIYAISEEIPSAKVTE
jgi:hypothetical protein